MAGMQFKLQIDMFDNEKIQIIQAMPKGDTLLIIWIRLIALADKCNANGFVQLEDGIPYTAKMLAAVFKKSLQMINLALTTFEGLRMVKNTDEGIFIITENPESKKEQIREQNRIRKQRERERKKEVASQTMECKNVTAEVTGMSHSVTDMSRDKEEKERSKEKEERYKEDTKKSPSRRESIKYQQIMDDYNRTCTSFTPICAVSDVRKQKIRVLIDSMEKNQVLPDKSIYERLHIIFQNAQTSDFLSGRNGRWTGCSFDWLINKANALKVLEGIYNKPMKKYQRPVEKWANRFCDFPQRDYNFGLLEQKLLSAERVVSV